MCFSLFVRWLSIVYILNLFTLLQCFTPYWQPSYAQFLLYTFIGICGSLGVDFSVGKDKKHEAVISKKKTSTIYLQFEVMSEIPSLRSALKREWCGSHHAEILPLFSFLGCTRRTKPAVGTASEPGTTLACASLVGLPRLLVQFSPILTKPRSAQLLWPSRHWDGCVRLSY